MTTREQAMADAKDKIARAMLGPVGFDHALPLTVEEAYAIVALGCGDSVTFGDREVLLTAEWVWRES